MVLIHGTQPEIVDAQDPATDREEPRVPLTSFKNKVNVMVRQMAQHETELLNVSHISVHRENRHRLPSIENEAVARPVRPADSGLHVFPISSHSWRHAKMAPLVVCGGVWRRAILAGPSAITVSTSIVSDGLADVDDVVAEDVRVDVSAEYCWPGHEPRTALIGIRWDWVWIGGMGGGFRV